MKESRWHEKVFIAPHLSWKFCLIFFIIIYLLNEQFWRYSVLNEIIQSNYAWHFDIVILKAYRSKTLLWHSRSFPIGISHRLSRYIQISKRWSGNGSWVHFMQYLDGVFIFTVRLCQTLGHKATSSPASSYHWPCIACLRPILPWTRAVCCSAMTLPQQTE